MIIWDKAREGVLAESSQAMPRRRDEARGDRQILTQYPNKIKLWDKLRGLSAAGASVNYKILLLGYG